MTEAVYLVPVFRFPPWRWDGWTWTQVGTSYRDKAAPLFKPFCAITHDHALPSPEPRSASGQREAKTVPL